MSLLNAQQCAWGKYIALPNALKGQKITNTPGQVLIDHSGTGNGIKKMTEQAMISVPTDIAELLINLTRNMAGASEIISGELIKSGMSGAAIAQLQGQAQVPIEDLRNAFWLTKRKIGLVLAQFMKQYYFKQEFFYEGEDEQHEKINVSDEFSSEDYSNVKFDVVVEATQGTRSSVASDISMLDAALSAGSITLETYIKAYPDSAIGNKTEILKLLEAEKNSELAIAKQAIEGLQGDIGKYAQICAEQQKIVDNIVPTIQENQRLNKFAGELSKRLQELGTKYATLYQQAKAFEGEAIKILQGQHAENTVLKEDATIMAQEILKNTEDIEGEE